MAEHDYCSAQRSTQEETPSMMPTVLTALCLSFAVEVSQVQQLIRQLGHDDFQKREAASTALTKIGPPALPFLAKEARNNPDPEIRKRANTIAQTILCTPLYTDLDKAAVLAIEHKKILIVFCGPKPKPDLRFPDCVHYWIPKPDQRLFYEEHPGKIQVGFVPLRYEKDESGKRTLDIGKASSSILGEEIDYKTFRELLKAYRGEP
jgi:hypothetical protein